MRFTPTLPPREFPVGRCQKILLKDCGRMEMEPDEQITFTTPTGAEYDVARKSWGFYATPSMNGRLTQFGLRGVLVKSPKGKYYLWLVERGKEMEFQQYLAQEKHRLIAWLDSDAALETLEKRMEYGLSQSQ